MFRKTKDVFFYDSYVVWNGCSKSILDEFCEWSEEIDLNRAKEAKSRAERRLSSGDAGVNIARAELALRKVLIRIELGQK